jgi:hypothetical protein
LRSSSGRRCGYFCPRSFDSETDEVLGKLRDREIDDVE